MGTMQVNIIPAVNAFWKEKEWITKNICAVVEGSMRALSWELLCR